MIAKELQKKRSFPQPPIRETVPMTQHDLRTRFLSRPQLLTRSSALSRRSRPVASLGAHTA
jgi:hypothetical protein